MYESDNRGRTCLFFLIKQPPQLVNISRIKGAYVLLNNA
jgi:hypothetical protein